MASSSCNRRGGWGTTGKSQSLSAFSVAKTSLGTAASGGAGKLYSQSSTLYCQLQMLVRIFMHKDGGARAFSH